MVPSTGSLLVCPWHTLGQALGHLRVLEDWFSEIPRGTTDAHRALELHWGLDMMRLPGWGTEQGSTRLPGFYLKEGEAETLTLLRWLQQPELCRSEACTHMRASPM